MYISNGTVVKADYRNGFMVTCELQSSRRKRSIAETIIADGYEISVSNDGIHFGDSVRIIIYDELCHECNSTTITCIVLVCFHKIMIQKYVYKIFRYHLSLSLFVFLFFKCDSKLRVFFLLL